MINFSIIFFAAIFKAMMDTLNFHFESSVFKNLPANFWNQANVNNLPLVFGVAWNAWHIAQYIVYGLLFSLPFTLTYSSLVLGYWDYLIYWFIYYVVFQSFWGYIFVSKIKI